MYNIITVPSIEETRMPGFDLHYHCEGDGTATSPAVLTFNFTWQSSPSLAELQAQLPASVTLTETGLGFEMRGVNTATTRVEILRIFDKLKRDNRWNGKHQA